MRHPRGSCCWKLRLRSLDRWVCPRAESRDPHGRGAWAELSRLEIGAETRGVSLLGAEPPERKEFEQWPELRDGILGGRNNPLKNVCFGMTIDSLFFKVVYCCYMSIGLRSRQQNHLTAFSSALVGVLLNLGAPKSREPAQQGLPSSQIRLESSK